MKSNTLVIIAISLIAAAGAYWYFFTGNSDEPTLSASTTTNQTQMRFQLLVGELRPISFDTGIFSDARFNALVDITTPITPETSGRLDPFAAVFK